VKTARAWRKTLTAIRLQRRRRRGLP